ncbi:MAG: ABC transporter substrate-binding protein [Alphaproteobacteria bacterium]|nr:MAG: ABC transporter substrate-binding protein [Alphaproteobacteria bacterium]
MRAAAWAAVGVLGFGLASAALAQTPTRGGVLRVAVGSEPPTTDCHAANTFTVIHHLAPHYSFLVRFDAKNYPSIEGDLARDWTASADGLSYTFRLHQPVRFHDGSPLTAADVKASYERIKTPPQGVNSPRREHFAGVTAIDAPDAETVVFRLRAPDPSFLTKLASPYNCIFSAAALAADPRYPEKRILGSGPFEFVSRTPGSEWVGKRFEGYFREGRPYLDGFRNILLTGSAMLNALQGGQVDAEFRGIAPAERDRLRQALGDRIQFAEGPWLSGFILSFNTEKAPFNDVRVRQALALAIDRWGAAQPLSRISQIRYPGGLLRPGFDLSATNEELQALPLMGRDMQRNRAEARRLLTEAGQSNLRFVLGSRTLPPYPTAAQFLIDQWRQIGVTVEQTNLETAAYFSAMSSGNFDAIIDFSTEFADEPNLQWVKYISMDRSPPPLNSARFTDRELDRLFDAQSGELDRAKRRVTLRQMEAHLINQAYMVPLFWFERIVPMAASVRGWDFTPSHLLNQDLGAVWLAR